MSHQCEQCETVVYRRRYSLEHKKHLGVECGCIARGRVLGDTTKSAFDITFDHVKDAFGNNLHVENIKQLEAAEKAYGFQSVVLHSDAQNFDDPPQQKRIDMAAMHNWKFSNEQRYRERYGR